MRVRLQAQAKSDPWRKRKRRVRAFRLWPEECWREMVSLAEQGMDWSAVARKWNKVLYETEAPRT